MKSRTRVPSRRTEESGGGDGDGLWGSEGEDGDGFGGGGKGDGVVGERALGTLGVQIAAASPGSLRYEARLDAR